VRVTIRIATQHRAEAGFTMVELIVSGALMSIILVSAYLCLSAGLASERLIESRSSAAQSARVALNLITADLRSAIPLSKDAEFIGMRRVDAGIDSDNLDFATRNYRPKTLREADFCEVSYFLEKDRGAPDAKARVLFRRRDPTPDPEPLSGGTREEIARGIIGFRIEYYDGYEWYDEWGDPEGKQKFAAIPAVNSYGLPEAVRVTITLDPNHAKSSKTQPAAAQPASIEPEGEASEPESLSFQTTSRVNLAAFFYRASSGSSSPNAENGAAAPAQTGGAP